MSQESVIYSASLGNTTEVLTKRSKTGSKVLIEVEQTGVDVSGITIDIKQAVVPGSYHDVEYLDSTGTAQTLGHSFISSADASELLVTDMAYGSVIAAEIDTNGATTGTIRITLSEYF